MTFVKKNMDVIITGVLIVLLGVVPLVRFLQDFHYYYTTYDSDLLELFEFWEYTLFANDPWIIVLSPIVVLTFSTYPFHKEIHSNGDVDYKKVLRQAWLRSGLLLLGYSLVLFVIALVVPTLKGNTRFDQPLLHFLFVNFNLVLYSLFITNLGLMMSTLIKNYFVAFIASIGSFIAVSLFLFVVGGIVEEVIGDPFNLDWLWIYNSFAFDSGMPYLFGFGVLSFLVVITGLVLRQLLRKEL